MKSIKNYKSKMFFILLLSFALIMSVIIAFSSLKTENVLAATGDQLTDEEWYALYDSQDEIDHMLTVGGSVDDTKSEAKVTSQFKEVSSNGVVAG
ncbi:MAG: hypothetical protein E7369_06300, partial [Clostridiales bacterium]|nr:hypothetical protein [Clostridiales bacterium]